MHPLELSPAMLLCEQPRSIHRVGHPEAFTQVRKIPARFADLPVLVIAVRPPVELPIPHETELIQRSILVPGPHHTVKNAAPKMSLVPNAPIQMKLLPGARLPPVMKRAHLPQAAVGVHFLEGTLPHSVGSKALHPPSLGLLTHLGGGPLGTGEDVLRGRRSDEEDKNEHEDDMDELHAWDPRKARRSSQPEVEAHAESMVFPVHLEVPMIRLLACTALLMLTGCATNTVSHTHRIHGVDVYDAHRWLEDEAAPEVQEWMNLEDKHGRAWLHEFAGRETLRERYAELYDFASMSAPIRRGDRHFYSRKTLGAEKRIHHWRHHQGGPEHVLIDPHLLSADLTTSIGAVVPSPEGTYVAYNRKENNADEAIMHVRTVATGKDLPGERIEGAKYAHAVWLPDETGFYYTWLPTDPSIAVDQRPGHSEIRFHALGTNPDDDPIIHPATGNPEVFLIPSLSRDGRWLFAYIHHGWNASDVHVLDRRGAKTWKPFAVGAKHHHEVIAEGDHFYIHTDDGAPRYRVMRTSTNAWDRASWQEIVPEQEAVCEQMAIVGGTLVLKMLQNATSQLHIHALEGPPLRSVPLPGIGTVSSLSGQAEHPEAFFTYTTFTNPGLVVQLDVQTGETQTLFKVSVPADLDDIEAKQEWYTSRDGTRVSMFVLTKRGARAEGPIPFLLYGYGGFNISLLPRFSARILPWLEAGGGYAVPNLRGGGEYGEAWHKAGMGARKQNVFDDFIAAAEHLIAQGHTQSDRLAIMGGSNGGLLVGAAMTQRPDLFQAVVCAVPLLDMVRYHLFGSGRTWISEYGSAEDPEEFKTLHAYSPYHRIVDGTDYPALLMLAADHDDRVDPLHARKFVARMRDAHRGDAPILMRIERNSGHGGSDRVSKAVEQSTDMTAFVMRMLGVMPVGSR